jgi:hypothetical protein
MMAARINGFSVAYAVAGGVILWSGIKGATISDSVRSILAGNNSPAVTETITGSSGGTSSGTSAAPAGSPSGVTEKANEATARLMAASYGWGAGQQWTALNNVVMSESGWNNTAQNPTSTAYGIFQFLDTTWASVGYTKTSDPVVQIAAGLAYIKQRYGNPVNAWQFHLSNGWY